MSIVEKQNTPTLGEMWQFIDKVLHPIGMTPDKASLDNGQVFKLYFQLIKLYDLFIDSIQVHVLRNELAYSLLENLVN